MEEFDYLFLVKEGIFLYLIIKVLICDVVSVVGLGWVILVIFYVGFFMCLYCCYY